MWGLSESTSKGWEPRSLWLAQSLHCENVSPRKPGPHQRSGQGLSLCHHDLGWNTLWSLLEPCVLSRTRNYHDNTNSLFFFLKILFISLRERVSTHKQGEWQREREKQTPRWAGSLMQDSVPGFWDHDLSWRQMLNPLSHPRAWILIILELHVGTALQHE